jgi:phosphate butyryltransferase
MKITCFDDLAREARTMAVKTVIAVVEAQDEHTLESVVKATRDGIMIPVLIGNTSEIKALLTRFGADPAAFRIVESGGVEESLQTAVSFVAAGKATAIMKGRLDSGPFMKAVVTKKNGLVNGGTLSLIGFYETPKYHKLRP